MIRGGSNRDEEKLDGWKDTGRVEEFGLNVGNEKEGGVNRSSYDYWYPINIVESFNESLPLGQNTWTSLQIFLLRHEFKAHRLLFQFTVKALLK